MSLDVPTRPSAERAGEKLPNILNLSKKQIWGCLFLLYEYAQASAGFASQLQSLMQELQRERGYSERILVQENGRARFLAAKEIAWVEADGNYLQLHCAGKTYTQRGTLESMKDVLDPKDFVRINRSSLVRLDAIRELVPWFHGEYKVQLQDATELRWSRRFVKLRPELLKGR
jgi:two-component system, LytTR family, response regulator